MEFPLIHFNVLVLDFSGYVMWSGKNEIFTARNIVPAR